MEFSAFIGHDNAKLALILNAIDHRCGGVLFTGEKGSGKTTLARLFKRLIPDKTPFVELPLNITEDALLGGIDIDSTIKAGRRILQTGILSRANGGVIYIDDINLLSEEILSIILEVQGRGEVIIEREGATVKEPSQFTIIASMNPEEGSISPHLLDRFGMCVIWDRLKDVNQKMDIIKMAIEGNNNRSTNYFRELTKRIKTAKTLINKIVISEQIHDYITQLCSEYLISGHRGDIYLTYAARAYTAYRSQEIVTKEDVEAVEPLVLVHRRRMLQRMEQKAPQKKQESETPSKENEKHPDTEDIKPPEDKKRQETENPKHDDSDELKEQQNRQQNESSLKEEIFDIGDTFKTRRLILKKDRIVRSASGRRTKTRAKEKSGRYVKSILRGKRDIAIDATLRSAAPFQKLRNRKDLLVIHDEDLRYKQRERRMGHLVIFVVDGSGSMGVQRRMTETKGAIQSLLQDCYQKRDRVSMILFRKDSAEVVLPPTSSLEMASKLLAEIPVGGKTPLPAGLLMTYKLIKNVMLKNPMTRFLVVIITDGRANQGISDRPVMEELEELSKLLSNLSHADYIVLDTEDKTKFIKTDIASDIAQMLDADYYTIAELKAEYISAIITDKKDATTGI